MANILVLDDEVDAVVLIRKVLRKKGHEVHAFSEEEEALKFARSNPLDLAILDMKLKKMSGIQVLEELRRVNPGISAMMLTGYPTVETAKEAVRLGAAQYCVKPIEIDELEEKVAEVLASRG
ncbi:MAG: response regulator [Deltaproteobacteria bacterium]|nr:response regulator [Deltaproteobacteria bacterium]